MNKQTEMLIRSPFLLTQHGYKKALEESQKLLNQIKERSGELSARTFMNTGQFGVEAYTEFFQVPLNERVQLKPINFVVITVAALDEDKIKAFLTEIQPALQRVSGTDLMVTPHGDVPQI